MNEELTSVARRFIAALGPAGWGRRPLADADVDALVRSAPPVAIAAGEVLAREGEPADRAFLLVAGRVRATVAVGAGAAGAAGAAGGATERAVNEIAAGEVTGESALFLTGGRRTATLTALEPTTALVLRRELFVSGAPSPALVALESHILTGLARRIERTDAQIVEAWRGAAAPSPAGMLAILSGLGATS